MMAFLRRLFDRDGAGSSADEPPGIPSEQVPDADGSGFGVPRDTVLSGWFNAQTGELFTGFAIQCHDVVLDVGCGDSPFAGFCAQQGAAVLFTDIDWGKVRATRQVLTNVGGNPSSPFVSDGHRLPLKHESVDKIISLEVLEHVDEPAACMRELVRVGRSGARYLITVPDPRIEKLQQKGLAPDAYFSPPNHVHIWEHAAFAQLIVDAGLEIERRERFGFYWSMWWIFFWACRQDLAPPWHPLLKSWTATWSTLLETEDGPRIKRALDDFMPKSQMIIARKP